MQHKAAARLNYNEKLVNMQENILYIMGSTHRVTEMSREVCAKLRLHIFPFGCNIYAR